MSPMRMTAVALALVTVLGCFVWVMVDAALPSNSALTMMRMKLRRSEIVSHTRDFGSVPATLGELGAGGGGSSVENGQDYWRRPLRYTVTRLSAPPGSTGGSSGVRVRLESFGADGVAGGRKENRDLSLEFDVEEPGPGAGRQEAASRPELGPVAGPATGPATVP